MRRRPARCRSWPGSPVRPVVGAGVGAGARRRAAGSGRSRPASSRRSTASAATSSSRARAARLADGPGVLIGTPAAAAATPRRPSTAAARPASRVRTAPITSPGRCAARPSVVSALALSQRRREAGVERGEGGVGRVVAGAGGQRDRVVPAGRRRRACGSAVCTATYGCQSLGRSAASRAGRAAVSTVAADVFQASSKRGPGAAGDQGQALVGLGVVGLDPRRRRRALTSVNVPSRVVQPVLPSRPSAISADRPARPAADDRRRRSRPALIRRWNRRASQTWASTTAGRARAGRRRSNRPADPGVHLVAGPVGVGGDQVVQDRQRVGPQPRAGVAEVLGADREALPVVGPGQLDGRGVVDQLGVQRGERRLGRPGWASAASAISWPDSVIASSYACALAGGSRPPTRNALVALASAPSRLVWICCTRISWAVSASARLQGVRQQQRRSARRPARRPARPRSRRG